jgi:hypothetical protein
VAHKPTEASSSAHESNQGIDFEQSTSPSSALSVGQNLDDRITSIDRGRGYQCEECVDRVEGRWGHELYSESLYAPLSPAVLEDGPRSPEGQIGAYRGSQGPSWALCAEGEDRMRFTPAKRRALDDFADGLDGVARDLQW